MLGVSLTITGMRVSSFTSAVTISTYSGTWPTAAAHAALAHAVRAAEIELDAVGAGVLDARRISFQASLFDATISETTRARSGQRFLTSADLAQVDLERPVGDQLDVVEADHALAVQSTAAVARADVDDGLAERLPHHAAPAGLEGAHDLVAAWRAAPRRARRDWGTECRQSSWSDQPWYRRRSRRLPGPPPKAAPVVEASPATEHCGDSCDASELLQNSDRGALAVRHRIHHFTAAVDAIAACVIFRIAGEARRAIHPDVAGSRALRAAWRLDRDCPSAGTTMSHATSYSELGIGSARGRPLASASVRRVRRKRTAEARPFSPSIATGCASQWNRTPSTLE